MSYFVKIIPEPTQHETHVQGHKVKYLNRYNSAADCSIAFKFGRVSSHHRPYTANVQGKRTKVKVTGSRSQR